jgi:cytochrome c-type biogenesis protein CcmH
LSRTGAAWRSALLTLVTAAAVMAQPSVDVRQERIGTPAGPPRSGAALERLTEEVSSLMRCPVCQGLSVNDSPTPLAAAMKNEVRDLLAAGYSREQVLEYFEQSYGEFIRLAPHARGFNLTVWLAPLGLLLLGLALILRRRRQRAGQPATAAEVDPDLAAYREQVRRELDQ